jgi:4-amino-4-deoxy-L-arabinose transferase-like glycosyltransferase
MPTTWTASERFRRLAPEAALAVLAGVVFLGFLGSLELWGKREQRASAEAIDTLDHRHWLVAQIQGRPRLEKPPLPRWSIAALMTLTGRRDEWMVRLPSALSALGMVGLVYALGRRIGGRSVGLASGLALTSMGFFISELRQAGNDGPLAFFTTLALYAAWRRLHGEDAEDAEAEIAPGSRRWNLVLYAAMGMGFLSKGPIAVLLVAVTVVPYLACVRRIGFGFGRGLALLADGWGAAVFLLLALSWPVPVLLDDPNAAKVWLLEIGQKAGTGGLGHHHQRFLAADWPMMTAPWLLVATLALALPFRARAEGLRPRVWFPWWWSLGNLAMFSVWSVAKPNYYLPCLPGVAVLCGIEWVRLARSARRAGIVAACDRLVLQLHWVVLFVGAMVLPLVASRLMPGLAVWTGVLALATAAGVASSAWLWRKGADAVSLAPLVGAWAVLVLIGYGVAAPVNNDRRGHRALAEAIDRLLPPDARTVMFFHELDEGLWFYLRGRDLVAVPGSQPRYNDAIRLIEDLRDHRFEYDPLKRLEAERTVLVSWLNRADRGSSFVLIRGQMYDLLAPTLAGLVAPVHRERGLARNELVLLRVIDSPPGPGHRAASPPIASGRPSPRITR